MLRKIGKNRNLTPCNMNIQSFTVKTDTDIFIEIYYLENCMPGKMKKFLLKIENKIYLSYKRFQKLEVIVNDFTFSTSSNISERLDYGTAKSCQWDPYVADATMSINLTGTPFRISESVSLMQFQN